MPSGSEHEAGTGITPEPAAPRGTSLPSADDELPHFPVRPRLSGEPAVPEFLAERETQLHLLDGHVSELRSGRAGLATVLGKPGTGRSALLRAAVARARDAGLPAVLARCSSAEADLRYGVVSQITSALAGAGHPAFSRRSWLRERTAATVIPALCGEFAALARKHPLLIALDDAQWMDEESKAWLAALAQRLGHVPILLIQAGALGAGRTVGSPADPGPAPQTVLQVPPLSGHGVRQVIASRCSGPVDEAFVNAAAEATAGSPAALHAVLDHFALESLPPAARYVPRLLERAAEVSGDRVATSLRCLPADALALLRVMAVCAGGLGFELLTSLAPPRTMSPEQALSVLLRLGLVAGGEYPRPAGSLVAELVLAGMDVEERQALAARSVELGYRAVIPEERLARLLLNAPPVGAGWVVSLLRRVAGRSVLSGDHETAAALLARALREPVAGEQRQRLLIELATTEVGDGPATSDRRLQQVLLNGGSEVPVLLQAADLLSSRGDASAAYRAVATAHARLESGEGAGCGGAGSLAAIGWLAENECATDPVLPVRSFPDPSERSADPVSAGIAAWMLATRGRHLARVRELARTAFQGKAEDRPFSPRIHAAWALCLADEVAEAVIGLDEVLADARRRGARAPAALALLQRSQCELRRGNLGQAMGDFEAARAELPLTSWHPRVTPYFVAMRACLALAGQDVEEAERALAQELPPGANQGAAWAMLLYARAGVHLELADPQAALRDIDECGRVLLARGWTNPAVLSWRSVAAAAHSARGDGTAARRLATEAVRRARNWGAPSTLGLAHLCGARVLSGAEAISELEQAVRILRDSVARGSYAKALSLLEEATRKAPPPRTQPIRHLAAVPERSSMPREMLRTMPGEAPGGTSGEMPGGTPGEMPGGTPHPLTAQEERIAALAAAGRSNACIAGILSVSVRTVELRLTGIYRKIAVTGRKELASRLATVTSAAPAAAPAAVPAVVPAAVPAVVPVAVPAARNGG
ncbi:AAA family ATPase [Nonomuraea sp. NPDC050404]|uniref:helix-turn-helix transcriptional regulator n=1 Tax=Nonomuraea sp. NPDC050404 TaxID=3155783 RepID=UPI0033D3677E